LSPKFSRTGHCTTQRPPSRYPFPLVLIPPFFSTVGGGFPPDLCPPPIPFSRFSLGGRMSLFAGDPQGSTLRFRFEPLFFRTDFERILFVFSYIVFFWACLDASFIDHRLIPTFIQSLCRLIYRLPLGRMMVAFLFPCLFSDSFPFLQRRLFPRAGLLRCPVDVWFLLLGLSPVSGPPCTT